MTANILSFFHRVKPALYYLLAALFLLFEMGVQSSPSVMAPQLMHQLDLGAAVFGTAMGLYFFSYTLMQIPVGLLYDRYSAKVILIIATAMCALGAYMFSLGTSVWLLGLARFLTGFGSAFAFVGVLVIANQWFEARYFALLVGIAQLLAAVGAMLGEMPLAYWVNKFGWRHASLMLAAMGVILGLLMLLFLRQRPVSQQATEVTSPLGSLRNICRNRQTVWIAIYAFSAWAPIALFAELWGVPYLMVKLGTDNIVAAKFCSLIWIALAITSPLLGWLSDRLQCRRVMLRWCSLIGFIGIILLLYVGNNNSYFIDLTMLTMGVAAAAQILTFALIRDNFPKQDLAVAIGIVNMAVVVGGAIFQPLVGLLLHWHAIATHPALLHHYTLLDYRWALVVIPACYAVGLYVSWVKIRDVNPAVS